MAFTRVKSTNWYKNDTLTYTQINQLDTNLSNSLDIRPSQLNESYSNVSLIDSDIKLYTSSSQSWNAAAFDFSSGNLETDHILQGNTTHLKFGWISEAVSTGSHTLSAAAQLARVVKLTGTRSASSTIVLPQVAGMEKIIINHIQPSSSTLNIYITLHTAYTLAFGEPGIRIPIPRNNTTGGKAIHVVCDGYRLYEVNSVPIHYVSSTITNEYKLASNSAYGTTLVSASNTSYASWATYSAPFTNLTVGDWFEITYNTTLTNSNSSGSTWIAIYLDSTTTPIKQSERLWTGTSKYTVSWKGLQQVTATSHTVGLCIKYSSYTGSILAPTSINIKVIKQ